MMVAIHSLANWQIIALSSGCIVALIVLAPQLRTRVFRIADNGAIGAGAFEAFKAVAAFTGFVLAFSLTQVQKELRDTEELVAREATAINLLDRLFVRSGDPALAGLRPDVVVYISGIVENEWPLLQDGLRSVQVDTLFRVVSSRARAMEPATGRQQIVYAEIVKTLDDVSDLRDLRISRASISLPPLFWLVSAGMVGLLLLLASVMPATVDRAFTLGGIAAAIGLLLALVAIIDGPFQGETSVRPDALTRVTKQIQERR